MSQLHTINNSALLAFCAARLQPGDGLVLIENAVSCATWPDLQQRLPRGVDLYVLEEDLQARGLKVGTASTAAEVITMAVFVRLCCDHDKVTNWF